MIATTTANLNLRKGAGTNYSIIRTLPKGTQVSISGSPTNVNGTPWYKVTEGEDTGYVSGAYLTQPTEAPGAIVTRGEFMDALLVHLGKPYRWGGNGPDNFDCSGYVGYVWRQLNLRQGDYTADAMYDNFRLGNWPGVKVAPEDADLGDLVFYGSGTRAGHVVFALSPGYVIGASGGAKSTDTDAEARARGAMVRIDRRDYRGDQIGVYRPAYGWRG